MKTTKKLLTLNQRLLESNNALLKRLDDAIALAQNVQTTCQNSISYITNEICKRYNVDEIEVNEIINQACQNTWSTRVDKL